MEFLVGWLCWGLTSQSTIFQSYRDGVIASWVINQYFRGVKCLAQGHNTAAVGFEPRTSRSGVRHSTTEPPRSPLFLWRNKQYYPLIINKYPPYLFHCMTYLHKSSVARQGIELLTSWTKSDMCQIINLTCNHLRYQAWTLVCKMSTMATSIE